MFYPLLVSDQAFLRNVHWGRGNGGFGWGGGGGGGGGAKKNKL